MAGYHPVRSGGGPFGHAAIGAVKFVLFAWIQLAVILVFDLLGRRSIEMMNADLRWFLRWCWPRWFEHDASHPRSSSR